MGVVGVMGLLHPATKEKTAISTTANNRILFMDTLLASGMERTVFSSSPALITFGNYMMYQSPGEINLRSRLMTHVSKFPCISHTLSSPPAAAVSLTRGMNDGI
jgi:hypothetical protein